MKILTLLFTILLVLAACAPASITPTSTIMAVSVATQTLTSQPASTATDLATPTPEASPTPVVPNYYPGVALTPEIFEEHRVEESQIKDIIANLRSKPSLIAPGTTPTGRLQGGSDTDKTVSLNPYYTPRERRHDYSWGVVIFDSAIA